MSETLSRTVRDLLWRVVGIAAVAVGYAAEAGFELEMRRVAARSGAAQLS
ncbi:hypothetical protein [Mycobacterium cookii]|nr:hypothetical protein [Mycobacterium cookii]MCV7329060.1 hypothetical protein [Mycobacterium cookii]